jgi:hypothetical protein
MGASQKADNLMDESPQKELIDNFVDKLENLILAKSQHYQERKLLELDVLKEKACDSEKSASVTMEESASVLNERATGSHLQWNVSRSEYIAPLETNRNGPNQELNGHSTLNTMIMTQKNSSENEALCKYGLSLNDSTEVKSASSAFVESEEKDFDSSIHHNFCCDLDENIKESIASHLITSDKTHKFDDSLESRGEVVQHDLMTFEGDARNDSLEQVPETSLSLQEHQVDDAHHEKYKEMFGSMTDPDEVIIQSNIESPEDLQQQNSEGAPVSHTSLSDTGAHDSDIRPPGDLSGNNSANDIQDENQNSDLDDTASPSEIHCDKLNTIENEHLTVESILNEIIDISIETVGRNERCLQTSNNYDE